MHNTTLAAALSLALVTQASVTAFGQMTDPYRSRTAGQSGYTGNTVRGNSVTGNSVQGTVRTNATTRSVRSSSNLGGSRAFDDQRTYANERPLRAGLNDSRLGSSQFERDPLSNYRTADNRGRAAFDRARLEDDDRSLDAYTDQDRTSSRREPDPRDSDQDYLDRRDLESRGTSTSDYNRRVPPLGNRDSRSGHPESVKAADLLRTWIELPADDDPRRVLSLQDAISRVNDTKAQIDVVKIYWGWVLAMAELRGMADEEAVLAEIARTTPPRSSYEQSLLRSSVEACRSRGAEAKRDVIARLIDLQEVSGQRSNQAQLPGNFPFVDAYDTQFDRTFANRTPPANLRKIHNTLPEDLKVIRARAVAADESMNLMAESAAAYFSHQIPLAEVLESIHEVRAQRRAFLEAVHHYNSTIAEYSLTVAGNTLSKDGIVSMLIGTSGRYVARQNTGRQRMAYGSTYTENLDRSFRSDPYTALGGSRGTYDSNRYAPAINYDPLERQTTVPVQPSYRYEDPRYRDPRAPYVR